MFSYLIFGITYAFAAAVQPGPLQTYIISQTLKKGWRSTLPAAFAPVISDIPILILILFLLSTMPANFIIILRIAGGLFLLYLAFKAFQSWQQFEADKTAIDESGRQTLFNAVFVNLLNPNPYLGWSLIMGPLFLEGWKIAPANGIALIASFYLTMILTLAGIIILFGFARKLGPQVSKVLIGLSSFVLLAFGIYQLWLGIISVSII
ncbi:LysE family transporter [Desulfobacula sp.]|uniref:LysE family translocator n=1 Tax=Desulfobacula sp. TaxID=2593537 RepID=UPI0025C597CD|nr:LysE family transporter [Desulfobacula sp.]MBC2704639.1 LysE family transporter [Desulfobacula sp.]